MPAKALIYHHDGRRPALALPSLFLSPPRVKQRMQMRWHMENVTSFRRAGLTSWHESDEEVRQRQHMASADTLLLGADIFIGVQDVQTAAPSLAIFLAA